LVFAKVILLFWGGLFVLVLSQLSTKFGTRGELISYTSALIFPKIEIGGIWWGFSGVFGTHLEHAWNIVGTIYIDCEGVTRFRGTGVEHAWNLGGTLFIFFACSRKHERWKNVNAGVIFNL
jgi:hypothetical protein